MQWTGIHQGIFLVNLFLVHLNPPPNFPIIAVTNFIWKVKVPLKARASVWTFALGRINTYDMLQKIRHLLDLQR